jgi:hypothetical protein
MKFTGTKAAPIISVDDGTVVRHGAPESVCINGGATGYVVWVRPMANTPRTTVSVYWHG